MDMYYIIYDLSYYFRSHVDRWHAIAMDLNLMQKNDSQ